MVAIINTGLTLFNKNPLPFETSQIEAAFTYIFDAVVTLIAWWKNNSFTKAAIRGDKEMNRVREIEKSIKKIRG